MAFASLGEVFVLALVTVPVVHYVYIGFLHRPVLQLILFSLESDWALEILEHPWSHLYAWVLDVMHCVFAFDFIRDRGAHGNGCVGHFLFQFVSKGRWKVFNAKYFGLLKMGRVIMDRLLPFWLFIRLMRGLRFIVGTFWSLPMFSGLLSAAASVSLVWTHYIWWI